MLSPFQTFSMACGPGFAKTNSQPDLAQERAQMRPRLEFRQPLSRNCLSRGACGFGPSPSKNNLRAQHKQAILHAC